MSSLQQLLSAYENNASTPKAITSREKERAEAEIAALAKQQAKEKEEEEEDAVIGEEPSSSEESEEEEEQGEELSLHDRRAAYEQGGMSSMHRVTKKADGPLGMSLKDRMAAYQQGVPVDDDEDGTPV